MVSPVVAMGNSTGPNPGWCYGGYASGCPMYTANEWNTQTTKQDCRAFRSQRVQLAALSGQVFTTPLLIHGKRQRRAVMTAVRQGVQHVISSSGKRTTTRFWVTSHRQRRSRLVEFGQAITPNQHNLAQASSRSITYGHRGVSYDGWLWSTAARSPDVVEHQYPVAYAFRGLSLDSEGLNRNVNVGIASWRAPGRHPSPRPTRSVTGHHDTARRMSE